jgi:hypothetical protein
MRTIDFEGSRVLSNGISIEVDRKETAGWQSQRRVPGRLPELIALIDFADLLNHYLYCIVQRTTGWSEICILAFLVLPFILSEQAFSVEGGISHRSQAGRAREGTLTLYLVRH